MSKLTQYLYKTRPDTTLRSRNDDGFCQILFANACVLLLVRTLALLTEFEILNTMSAVILQCVKILLLVWLPSSTRCLKKTRHLIFLSYSFMTDT